MKIIDFHTHPYIEQTENIKNYPVMEQNGFSLQRQELEALGLTAIAGSVIYRRSESNLANMQEANRIAFAIQDTHPDFYIPGIQINPIYMKESCETVEKAYKKGVRLIGELTPYTFGQWEYHTCGEIFALAQDLGMVVSCHPTNEEDMRKTLAAFPRLTIVFAHPGEKPAFTAHLERMKDYKNMYLDISGTGIFRYGLLRYGIDMVGKERFLFGSDFPTCNPGGYIGSVQFEKIKEDELEHLFYKNAERILGL